MLEKVSKSVVNISVVKHVHHMFYQTVPVEGMGSGTITDSGGYILTNNHVTVADENKPSKRPPSRVPQTLKNHGRH